MGIEGPLLPARLSPDTRPIRSTLARLWRVCPDRYALACAGIGVVCRNVRSWAPLQLADGVGWNAVYVYPGMMIEFVYGWVDGIERLIFLKLGAPRPGMPFDVYWELGFSTLEPKAAPSRLPRALLAGHDRAVAVEPLRLVRHGGERELRRLGDETLLGLGIEPPPATIQPIAVRPPERGYHIVYREHEVNHCPGCGRTHWYVGRTMAECGFCATALPLETIPPAAGARIIYTGDRLAGGRDHVFAA